MMQLFPSQIRYLNAVNALARATYGVTVQDAGEKPEAVVQHGDEGFTEQQFVDYFAQKHDLTPKGV